VIRFHLKLAELIMVPVDEPGAHGGQAGHVMRAKRINDEVAQMQE